MKTFNESFLTSKRLPVILEKTINVDWTKGTDAVRNEVLKNIQSEIEDMMRKEIDDKIRQFYIDNPRKFNYSYSTKSEYSISMKPFDESKKYQQLVSLYDSIGMGRAFDSRDDVNTCMITASTKNKKEVDNIKYVTSKKDKSITDNVEYGNGYNNLDADVITEYRKELFSVFAKKADVKVTKCERTHKFSYDADTDYIINIYPVIDESKIKKLEEKILSNDELMEYRDKLTNTRDGILQYYNSKKSGDYTGD